MSAPKVSAQVVESMIVGETYTVLPDGRTTICQLTLENGFTVDGKSACVVKENFDAAEGKKWARLKALDQVWFLAGYTLAAELHALAELQKQMESQTDELSKEVIGGMAHGLQVEMDKKYGVAA